MAGTTSDAVANAKLKLISDESLRSDAPTSLEAMMLPNFAVDWTTCYAEFMACHSAIKSANKFLLDVIATVESPFLK